MEFKYFKKYSEEIILSVLERAQMEYDKLKETGEISQAEIVKTRVMDVYSKLYAEIKSITEDIYNEKSEEVIKIILEIRDNNKLTDDEIVKKMGSREDFTDKSGAEVVKRLFEYSLKNLKKQRSKLMGKLTPILKEEEELETNLKEAIQYEDEMRISARIVDVRDEKRPLVDVLVDLEEKIRGIEADIESEWKYKIYGYISQRELEKRIDFKK